MTKKANIAVIGCGGLAQSQHISNLIQCEKTNLCCFCDINTEILEDLSKRFPHVPIETDYKKVLNNPDIDGVVIATKEAQHVPLTIEALHAGKYVYVEKPLGETPEECEKVMEAERETGRKALVGMNRRCAPAYRDVKAILDRNGGMKTAYYRIADDWVYRGKDNEEYKSRYYGNRMIIECCHIIDILRYFANDSDVKKVYCHSPRLDEESIILEFENGSSAILFSTGYAPRETPKEHLEITTEYGFITVDDFCELHSFGIPGEVECKYYKGRSHVEHDYLQSLWYANEGIKADIAMRKFIVEEEARLKAIEEERVKNGQEKPKYKFHELYPYYTNYGVDKGWLGAMEHFADVILNGETPKIATAIDGYKVAKIVDAITESKNTGMPVEIK